MKNLLNQIFNHDRKALAKAITLVESTLESHKEKSNELIQQLIKENKNESVRIALSGTPGAGKSTFIESFGSKLINNGKKVFQILRKYKPNCIFNLAAETHVDRSIDGPESFMKSNILGVFNLLQAFKKYIESSHEAPIRMIFPLMVLGIGSIVYGFLSRDLMIGLGSLFFNNIFTNYYNFNLIDSEFLPSLIKNIPLIFTILGSFCSLLLINCLFIDKSTIFKQKLTLPARLFYIFLNKK